MFGGLTMDDGMESLDSIMYKGFKIQKQPAPKGRLGYIYCIYDFRESSIHCQIGNTTTLHNAKIIVDYYFDSFINLLKDKPLVSFKYILGIK
jgi:hypothetical protein